MSQFPLLTPTVVAAALMKPRLSQGRSPLFSSALSCQAAIGFAGPPRFRSFFGENGLFVLRETAAPGSDSVSTQTSALGLGARVGCLPVGHA